MHLDSYPTTYIIKTFTKPWYRDNHIDVAVFDVIIAAASLVSLVVVLGLLNTISIVDVGLEYV